MPPFRKGKAIRPFKTARNQPMRRDLMRLEIPIPRPAALALLEMANERIRREIAVMEALEAKIAAIGGQQADNIH